MKKFLPVLLVVVLMGVFAVVVWAAPSTAQTTEQGASVCLQWATVTPQVCNCDPTATATIRVTRVVSRMVSDQ